MKNTHALISKAAFAALAAASIAGCSGEKQGRPPTLIKLAVSQAPATLDPVLAVDAASAAMASYPYEGLMGYPSGKRPYKLEPVLAEAYPVVSADQRAYLFKLRKGALFHDDAAFKATGGRGREVVAEDIVYSLKRLADPHVTSPGWWILEGRVAGLDEWRARQSKERSTRYDDPVPGLEALDRYTVRISLVKPYHQFLFHLATPFAFVVPREAVERYKDGFGSHPVGSSNYRYSEALSIPGSRYVWDAVGTVDSKHVERVDVAVIPSSARALEKFTKGTLDVVTLDAETLPVAAPAGALKPELAAKGAVLQSLPMTEVVGLAMNLRTGPLSKSRGLRQAVVAALDVERFLRTFYPNSAVSVAGPIPSGMDGAPVRRTASAFDLAEARKHLRASGFPGGLGLSELEYLTLSEGAYPRMAEFIKMALAAAGIPIKITAVESWEEFLTAVKAGKADLWLSGWSADYPDPESFLQAYYGKNASGGPNDTGYASIEYDELYEKLLRLAPGRPRMVLLGRMEEVLRKDVPVAWMFRRLRHVLFQAWVKDPGIHEFDGALGRHLGVDRGPKKE